MAAYEAKEGEVLVYAESVEDLALIEPDLVLIKHAFIMSDGSQYILPPGGEDWKKINVEGVGGE